MKTAQLFQSNSPIRIGFKANSLEDAIAQGRTKFEKLGLIGRCYIQFNGITVSI